MAFAGIPNAKDRADLISYLKTKVAEWWWSPRCLSDKKSALRELPGCSSECHANGASLSDAADLRLGSISQALPTFHYLTIYLIPIIISQKDGLYG